MIGRSLPACTLFFIATLIPTLSAATDDAIRVEVERPRLVADKPQSPVLAGINLVFDARFTNHGDGPVEIPDRELPGGGVGISQHGVESQRSDGRWTFVEHGGDVMWKVDTVFPRCRSLNLNETSDVKGISGPFVVFKSSLGGLGARATIRLYLALTCKQKDGNLVLKTVQTNPFVLSLPPLQ